MIGLRLCFTTVSLEGQRITFSASAIYGGHLIVRITAIIFIAIRMRKDIRSKFNRTRRMYRRNQGLIDSARCV
jgi:hypothetical protein